MPLRRSFTDRARLLIFYLLIANQAAFGCVPSKSTEMPIASTKAPKTCKTGYTFFATTGFCYKAVSIPAGISEAAAQAACAADGGNLVSIHSAAENAFVYSLILGTGVALSDNNNCNGPNSGFWIGLQLPTPAKGTTNIQWIDGTPFNYDNFQSTQPDDACGNEMCGFIEVSDGTLASFNTLWADIPCTSGEGYVCKQPES